MKWFAVLALLTLATLTVAQRPIGYQPPTIADEVKGSQITLLGTITDVANVSAQTPPPSNAATATVSIQCVLFGTFSGSTVTIDGFGVYNSYCSSTATVGFAGLFFVNQTDNSTYVLADHCNPLFDNSTANLKAVAAVPGVSSSCAGVPTTGTTASGSSGTSASPNTKTTGAQSGSASGTTTTATAAAATASTSGAVKTVQAELWMVMSAFVAVSVTIL